jgi:RNA polymerase sigma-70 factor (ECF subfamily)
LASSPPNIPDAYRRLAGPVRAKCRRMLGDTQAAEDVAQEVFVRLWQTPPTFDSPEHKDATEVERARMVVAWAYRTSSRLAIDVMRARKKWEPLIDKDARALPCGVHEESAMSARSVIVKLAADVPDDELEAALLCRIDGLSQPEAANVMGISERTIRRLIERFDTRTKTMREAFTQ